MLILPSSFVLLSQEILLHLLHLLHSPASQDIHIRISQAYYFTFYLHVHLINFSSFPSPCVLATIISFLDQYKTIPSISSFCNILSLISSWFNSREDISKRQIWSVMPWNIYSKFKAFQGLCPDSSILSTSIHTLHSVFPSWSHRASSLTLPTNFSSYCDLWVSYNYSC